MTHLELAKEKLAGIEKRLRFCKGQEIPYDQDPAEELRLLNRRREEVAEAEFDAELLREYIEKWERKTE